MRKFVFSLFLILVYALNFAGLNIKSAAAQDSLELVCSAPANGAELEYLPATVVLRFSADLAEGTAVFVADEATSARVDVSGSLVVEGAIATVGVDTSSDPDSEGGDADTAYLEAGKAYEVFIVTKVDSKATRFTITFSIAEGVTEVQPMALNDCEDGDVNGDGVDDNAAMMPTAEPTEEATAEATEEATTEPTEVATEEATAEPTEVATEEATPEVTEEATAEPTEEATAEATEEATAEPTEVATEEATPEVTEEATAEPTEEATEVATEEATPESTLAEPQPYTAGTVNFTVSVPAGYAVKTDENFFVLPVVVAAADEATVDAYLANPDAVQGFAVIFTTFTSADLASFGLAAEATPADIIAALVRADSTPSEPVEASVAGAPALKVDFTNATSGKSGTFYLVSFEGGNYLLIQGSAATADWPNYTATFEEVVAAIAVTAE
ncbi:MAG: hypothetical protein BroJett018_02310 [Chloroflexota bacterium]|nr:hypothetical protein [Chloroflexota bacterium]GIK62437.1 MAG: hypothetical protein BroJett018_02310 [Chloroflexota bacterium]